MTRTGRLSQAPTSGARRRYVDLAWYLARSTLRAGLLALLLMALLYGVGAALHPQPQPQPRRQQPAPAGQALRWWIVHTPACLGPACIDVFDDEVQFAWRWRAPEW